MVSIDLDNIIPHPDGIFKKAVLEITKIIVNFLQALLAEDRYAGACRSS